MECDKYSLLGLAGMVGEEKEKKSNYTGEETGVRSVTGSACSDT